MDQQRNHIISRIVRSIVFRDNLWAFAIAILLILLFTCATMGVQPRFVYTGF